MAKGLGIAALVIGIVAIFVPVVALYVVWIALILAALAALFGDKMFSTATLVISVINVLFLSPLTVLVLVGESGAAAERGGNPVLLIVTVILFASPIVALILHATGKVVLGAGPGPASSA